MKAEEKANLPLLMPKIGRQVPSSQITAAGADLLVPFYFRSAAPARPFFLLGLQPFLEAIFLDVFQIWFHGPMVRPFVGHEFMKRRAREFITKTAESEIFICGALPEPASFDPVIRAAAATAVTV